MNVEEQKNMIRNLVVAMDRPMGFELSREKGPAALFYSRLEEFRGQLPTTPAPEYSMQEACESVPELHYRVIAIEVGEIAREHGLWSHQIDNMGDLAEEVSRCIALCSPMLVDACLELHRMKPQEEEEEDEVDEDLEQLDGLIADLQVLRERLEDRLSE